MSNSPLDWQFHDDQERQVEIEGAPRRRTPSVRWGKIVAIALGFLVVLVVVTALGFGLGRYQRASTAARADIQAALDVETWVWQGGNTDLFQTTLDPGARSQWRSDLTQQFAANGRDIRNVRLSSVKLLSDTTAQVEVDVSDAKGTHKELRYYRLVQGQWRRTSPVPGT
ncbi:MAG: hypothetical protein U0822_10305 [Anaerolineae bacterium]